MTSTPVAPVLFVLEYTSDAFTTSFAVGPNPKVMKDELRNEGRALAFNDPVPLDRLDRFPALHGRFRAHLHALQS